MKRIAKARAMQCFGKLTEYIELDPDPKAKEEMQEYFNCKECDSYGYCAQLGLTL